MGGGLMMRGFLDLQPPIKKVTSITWFLKTVKNHPEGRLNTREGVFNMRQIK